MSIYSALRFEIPVIAYCALHQVRKGISRSEYERTMKDFHRVIREHSNAVLSEWETYQAETTSHSVQRQRSLLAQFLSTPLKSDQDEIESVLRGELVEYAKRILPSHPLAVVGTLEGRVVEAAAAKATARRLLLAGKRYLSGLGFITTKARTDIYESMFVFEGSQNIDVIEHLVRDRIGIYTPVHGKHIKEFGSYAYAAYNLVYESGERGYRGNVEGALFFSKGETHYAPFRNALKETLDSAQDVLGFPHVSVWQRKLGLGSGTEFVLRVRSNGMDRLGGFFDSLPAMKRKEFVTTALRRGNLILKEMVNE